MTLEQAALASLSAVTGALCYLFNIIRLRSEECEKWRAEKGPLITEMANKLGIAEATASIVNGCHIEECPFRGKLDTSYSLSPKEKNQ